MKVFKKIFDILLSFIIIVGVIFLGLYIFGITPYVVLSGSMEPTIQTGSLCFINKNASYKDIKNKDIIAFKLKNGSLVTHRVVDITNKGFITKGDNNKIKDKEIVNKNNYIGKNIFWIPKIGYVIRVFQSTRGKIIFITSLIVLLVFGLLFGEGKKENN